MFKRNSRDADDRLGRAEAAGGETVAESEAGATRPGPHEAPRGIDHSVIQSDLVIKGEILARGALELNGLVDGNVAAQVVLVGENAVIRGDVIGERVSIKGDVRGRVMGRDVHLGAGARYFGDIRRERLSIEDGAIFEGAVMGLKPEDEQDIASSLKGAAPERLDVIDVVALGR